MSTPPNRWRRASLALGLLAFVAAACGSSSTGSTATTAATSPVKPIRVYPGPAGLLAGAQPQPNGYLWLLARRSSVADLQELDLTTGKIAQIVPASASSTALSQSPSGVIGVGLATASTGALELRNGTSGSLVATVPIGAPVKDVVAGADGTTFYVLNGTPTSLSVTLVNAQTDKASVSVPVPLDTVAIAVDPTGQSLFALRADGHVDEVNVGTGSVAASFAVGANPFQLTTSNTGSTLYVLKSTPNGGADVGVVDLATESQTMALPAPAHSVDVQVSPDGRTLYLVVGTSTYGNVQLLSLSP
ncbi:MAG: YncE family protein [Acidimicrobiales bacterium]